MQSYLQASSYTSLGASFEKLTEIKRLIINILRVNQLFYEG